MRILICLAGLGSLFALPLGAEPEKPKLYFEPGRGQGPMLKTPYSKWLRSGRLDRPHAVRPRCGYPAVALQLFVMDESQGIRDSILWGIWKRTKIKMTIKSRISFASYS